jgi:tetratricopeptide (TPR) repeat protein
LYKEGIDTIHLIESRFPNLDQRQQDYLGYYKYDFDGKNVLAFNSCLKELNQNKKDLFINTTGMVMAMEYLNDPSTTIKIFNQIDFDNIDLSTCPYCITRLTMALKAFIDLPNLKKAEELVERIRPYATKTTHFIDLIEYYIKIKDTTTVNDIIRVAANREGSKPDEEPYICLMTARMATVNGDLSLNQRYAERAIQFKEGNTKATMGRAQMLIGDLERAKNNFIEILTSTPDANTYSNLGIVYARLHDKEKANQMIQKLNDLKGENDFGKTPYLQGRIKANLGDSDEAIKYLNISLDEGYRFITAYSFHHDPDLMILNPNPEYQALLIKNRQPH